MKKSAGIVILSTFLLSSCATAISYAPMKNPRTPKPPGATIAVYQPGETLPRDAVVLGRISVNDTGFSVSCDYNTVLAQVEDKAREQGGDAVRIVLLRPPDYTSTCYRIDAEIIAFGNQTQPNSVNYSDQPFQPKTQTNTRTPTPSFQENRGPGMPPRGPSGQ